MIKNTWSVLWSLALLVFGGAVMAQEDEPAPSDGDALLDDQFLEDEPEFFEFDSPAEIEELLSEEWRLMAGETQPSYEPGNRPDPFLSLIPEPGDGEGAGARPEGVPGLLIDDLEVTGIVAFGAERAAQVRAADRAVSYLVREGDRLYDGDVVSIRSDEVVFQQIVDEPGALRPFRTVVKKLRPDS